MDKNNKNDSSDSKLNEARGRNSARAQLRERIQDLETYVAGRNSHWDALTSRLRRERQAIDDLKIAVSVRDARIAGFARTTARLEKRIDGQRREIELLRDRLTQARRINGGPPTMPVPPTGDEAKVILRAAYDKLASMRTEQNRLNAKLDDKNAYIDRLCGRLSELELERGETTRVLRRQREIIDHIEAEIRARLAKVALSSRKPKERQAISASLHKLDEQRARLRERLERESVTAMGRLTLLADAGKSIEYEVGTSTVTIGRGQHNDIRIRRQSVSREHARLTPSGDGVFLEDLSSRNGVRVNNRRVARHRLRSGDIVMIGQVRFRFTESVIPISRPNAS